MITSTKQTRPLALLIGALALGFLSFAEPERVLRVLNWSAYIAVDYEGEEPIEERSPILREFAERHNCRIEYFEYEETVEALSRISNTVGFYDVVIASMGEVRRMKKGGYLRDIDHRLLSNLSHLGDLSRIQGADQEGWNYAVPYLYGTTGIAYRADLVNEPIHSWSQLFKPDDSLKGRISILNDGQVMLGIANLYLGNGPNSDSEESYRESSLVLRELKSEGFLKQISSDVEKTGELLVDGEVSVAVMYSGDALSYSRKNPNIKYTIPSEGSEFYVDSMAILKGSKSVDLAHEFIDFILEPRIGAMNSISVMFPTFNASAVELMRQSHPELVNDVSIFPTDRMLERVVEFYQYSAIQQQYWNRLLHED